MMIYKEESALPQYHMSIKDYSLEELITLDEAKAYLRVENNKDDILISKLIIAARQYAENRMRISLTKKTVVLDFYNFLPVKIFLPYGPAQQINRIILKNKDSEERIVDSSLYELTIDQSFLNVQHELFSQKITVEYSAEVKNIDECIITAMKSHIFHLYNFRDSQKEPSAIRVYDKYRQLEI